jgi:uncharacterized protein YbaA (DUF1428 family)
MSRSSVGPGSAPRGESRIVGQSSERGRTAGFDPTEDFRQSWAFGEFKESVPFRGSEPFNRSAGLSPSDLLWASALIGQTIAFNSQVFAVTRPLAPGTTPKAATSGNSDLLTQDATIAQVPLAAKQNSVSTVLIASVVAAVVVLAGGIIVAVWIVFRRRNQRKFTATNSKSDVRIHEFGDEPPFDHEFTNPLAGDLTLTGDEDDSDLNPAPDEGL